MHVRFLDQGDTSLVLELGDTIDPAISVRVTSLDRRLQYAMAAGRLDGVIEIVPTYRSLTVIFDPLRLPRRVLKERLAPVLNQATDTAPAAVRHWCLPVCYDPVCGPDLENVASARGLTTAEVVSLHSGVVYTVYMIGFLPGFPYLGDLDPELQMPRHTDPRLRVPRGSVAITGRQTAVYPWESPGGWQLIGRCPLPLFDARRPQPALIAQGDRVSFNPMTLADYTELESAASSLDLRAYLSTDGGSRA